MLVKGIFWCKYRSLASSKYISRASDRQKTSLKKVHEAQYAIIVVIFVVYAHSCFFAPLGCLTSSLIGLFENQFTNSDNYYIQEVSHQLIWERTKMWTTNTRNWLKNILKPPGNWKLISSLGFVQRTTTLSSLKAQRFKELIQLHCSTPQTLNLRPHPFKDEYWFNIDTPDTHSSYESWATKEHRPNK